MDMNYIKTKFLSYQNIVSWCNNYAKENGCKANIRLIDHKNHKTVDINYVSTLLYNMNVPSFRNSYNLRSFNKEQAVFYLTVRGTGIVIVCDFIYPVQKENDYVIEPNGQLRFVL